MDARQEAKLSMCQGVKEHLTANESIHASNVAFTTAFNKNKTKIADVVSTTQAAGLSIVGHAVEKRNFTSEMCVPAAMIAGIVRFFVKKTRSFMV